MLNKIVARFKAKKLNENVEQKYKHFNKVTRIGGNILNNIFAYPDPNGSATKEQLSKYETKEGQAKFKVIFCKTKEEAEKKAKKLNELDGNPHIKAIETDKPVFRYINGKAVRTTKDDLKKLFTDFSDNHSTLQSFAKKNGIAIEYAKDIVTAGQYYTEQDKKSKKVDEVYNEGSNKEIEDIKQRRDSVDLQRANAYRQYMQAKRNLENPKDLEQIEKEWNAINSKLKKKSDDLSKQIRNRPKNKSFFGNDTESGEDKG